MTGSPQGLRRRLVLSAAAAGIAVAVVQGLVTHAVIDAVAEEEIAERVERYTVWATVGAGVVMVLLATALAAWASKRALEPVTTMARTAAQWSEHDLDRRFDLGAPTDELRSLGQTLDGLLDKVSRAIHGEQRLTSELAHELRTPLAAIRATADLMAMRPDLDDETRSDVEEIRSACEAMAGTITGLLDLARATRTGTVETGLLRDVLEDATARVGPGEVSVIADDGLVVGVPALLAVRALHPVVANAARVAQHVTVLATRSGRWIEVAVCDDGPGVPSSLASSVFEPGTSGAGSSGLGLALARRIARSVGGDILLEPPQPGAGAIFIVRLPAAN